PPPLRLSLEAVCSAESLDTAEVSQRVRELLSLHNIGQRLFAKSVLGLSQGTVSELLSKPKCWEKLTEKGRESYRKMHSWACSEANIILLKSLTPKKAKELSPPAAQKDDSATEERIAQILNDAQRQMKTSPLCLQNQDKQENGGMSSAMVSSIYQQELAKIIHQQRSPPPSCGGGSGGEERNKRSHSEDLLTSHDMVMRIYQEELAKLGQPYPSPRAFSSPPGGATSTSAAAASPNVKTEPVDAADCDAAPLCGHEGALRHAGSAFSLVRPRADAKPADVSPLQRMQSIANSLMQQQMALPAQRPLKAVLPPVTQEQFDKYGTLNTEEIVRQIKEQLSQYSISQRLFGETVLGLSQGSVSDLLARPKPWHMLTQKGREPFIRMQMFLEEENSIPQLLANQYKIQPDKFTRSSIASMQHHFTPKNNIICEPILQPSNLHYTHHHTAQKMSAPVIKTAPPAESPSADAATSRGQQQQQPPPPPPPPQQATVQPSVFELAALTTDLDTHVITSRIKEVLVANNIGQKLFGEAVLGLSQVRMKRKRTLYDPIDASAAAAAADAASSLAAKKPRILFTDEQKYALKAAYAHDPYPSTQTIEGLATSLRLSTRTVVNWFHNHRMRLKQQLPHRPSSAEESGSRLGDSSEDLSNLSGADGGGEGGGGGAYLAEYGGGGGAAGGGGEGETSQWLFPSFQRVDNGGRRDDDKGATGGSTSDSLSAQTSPVKDEDVPSSPEGAGGCGGGVNGEWKDAGGGGDERKWTTSEQPSEIINGVCIRQTSALLLNGGCDVAVAPPGLGKAATMSIENVHLQQIERLNRSIIDLVEGGKPPTPPGSETHSSLSRPGSASSSDGRTIEAAAEDWDEPQVKKLEQETNIEKMQQSIAQQPEEEEWEF
ncbi:PREDICTED: homeobox protein cut-like, partial [Priapulus caudatus]|uniref:DNA-binding protein SATB n=1 Tax=Priapulus caudatus TaxID=37621 RepID=A0ABM1EEZ9_PRICU